MTINSFNVIGGYFELEQGQNKCPVDGVYLNSGRNALRYILRVCNIKEIYAPFYTCPTVWRAIRAEKCKIIPYDIDDSFLPLEKFPQRAFVLYNNWFGINGKNVRIMMKNYPNLIVDNAQSFYSQPCGLACFYSPRKFFPLPDGGIAVCNKKGDEKYEQDFSFDRCLHLLKRVDLGASAGFEDFQKDEAELDRQPIKEMSNLTKLFMTHIDYKKAKRQRLKNFAYLQKHLGGRFNLSSDDVPLAFPYRTNNLKLRAHLIKNKIFVATYWPKEKNSKCMTSKNAQNLSKSIIPLPIDQRYNEQGMQRIIEEINKCQK